MGELFYCLLLQYKIDAPQLHSFSSYTNVCSHIILLHYNMQSIYITEELETQFQEQVSSAIRSN